MVAAAVIARGGQLLVTQRPAGKPMAGLWEFPGGKLEAGEAPKSALCRELLEELGIRVHVGAPIDIAVDAALRVMLIFYACRLLGGEPYGAEGQSIAWVDPAQLIESNFPPADAALIRRLRGGGAPFIAQIDNWASNRYL